MPELPEVEHARRRLEAALVGRRIEEARCADDAIVFEGVFEGEPGPEAVARALRGRRVIAVRRRGKYLWLELDRAPHVVLHLGMTGQWRTPGDEPLRLESSPKVVDRAWPPRFTKLELVVEGGAQLAMTDPRRFGRVMVRADPPGELPISALGFDPLTDLPDEARFAALVRRRDRAVLKSLLLDQGFAAGVGNWIADEVLYQAGLDPRRRVGSLDAREISGLYHALAHVVRTAVDADAQKDAFPKDWLFHRRWGKKPLTTTLEGEPIEHLQVGGRTTAWVPTRQR